MKILVINAGSSSLKFQLFDNLKPVYKGLIERVKNHEQALKKAISLLHKNKFNQIDIIGHRVVHGGEKYKNPTLITPKVIQEIKKLEKLAPLHNPHNLAAILACKKLFPHTKQVAIFDTAFHQTMPEKAYLYALPYSFYQKYKIRKYGFHGSSNSYVSKETIKLLKKKNSKIIICHLGNGCSVTAIKNGKSIDSSMGFTPLEGLPMGTRSGDIDPGIIFHLIKTLKKTPNEIENILNKKSGFKGISNISSDIRDLFAAYKKNNPAAKRTFELFCYRLAKYIGSYITVLNGIDAITFTGGIGENAYYLREKVCKYLNFIGFKLDSKKNRANNVQISSKSSKIKGYVISTNEEKEISTQITKNKHVLSSTQKNSHASRQ